MNIFKNFNFMKIKNKNYQVIEISQKYNKRKQTKEIKIL